MQITFFWKKDSDPEKVALAELDGLANSIFEERLGNLGPRAQSEIEGLRSAATGFAEACDRFNGIDAEPYVQDLWMPNINALKSQKGNYAKALKHAIEKLDLSQKDTANTYDKYNGVLSEIDRVTNELLAVNANFKTVMYCFSKHLSGLKHAFSMIERHRESLRTEITKRSEAAVQHSKTSERILALNALIEESEAFRNGAEALRESISSGSSNAVAEEESNISSSISSKVAEMSSIDAGLSMLSSQIGSLTLTLERPSRKQDHLSVRKRHLHPMMTNPEEGIKSRADSNEFTEMVRELRDNIEKNVIEVKNKDGTLNTISELLNSDIYSMLESVKSLKQKRSDVKREIGVMEGALEDVKKGKVSAAEAREEIKKMEGKAAEAEKSINPAKEALEVMFFEYYKKRITIVL